MIDWFRDELNVITERELMFLIQRRDDVKDCRRYSMVWYEGLNDILDTGEHKGSWEIKGLWEIGIFESLT